MRILEAALYAENLDETAAFYEDVLQMKVFARVVGRHVFFRGQGAVLLLFRPSATAQPPQPGTRLPVPPHGAVGPGHVCFGASAAQINYWAGRLKSHGIGIEADFEWPQGGRSIYFRDPSGNAVEFAEPLIWGLD